MTIWRLKESSSLVLIFLGIITGITIITIGLIMTFKYAPMRQHQQPLILKLESFTITNLKLPNSVPEAIYSTAILFANRNDVLEIFIPSFESLLYYNHSKGKSKSIDPISCTVIDSVHLGPKRQKLVEVSYKSSECGGEQPFVDDKLVGEMMRDGERGGLVLCLEFSIRVKYRTGILNWDYEFKPDCPCFFVKFVIASGVGWLQTDDPIDCLIR